MIFKSRLSIWKLHFLDKTEEIYERDDVIGLIKFVRNYNLTKNTSEKNKWFHVVHVHFHKKSQLFHQSLPIRYAILCKAIYTTLRQLRARPAHSSYRSLCETATKQTQILFR